MNLNQVNLIGRLVRDPELKVTPNGAKVATASLATGRKYKNQKTNQLIEETEYHNLVIWGRLAEIVQQYCMKGSQLYIRGRLATRSWDDKQSGQKKVSYRGRSRGAGYGLKTSERKAN